LNKVEAYIVDHEYSELLYRLRQLILSTTPGITEKLAYGIPFFYYKGRLCYLHTTKSGIDVSFLKGTKIVDELGHLELRKRKQIMSFVVPLDGKFDEGLLRFYLQEAIALND